MGIRKKTEAFINDSIKCHGKKYDYSKVDYNSNRKKVCIICPEHGEFWQTPSNHLKGHGCPKCGNNTTIKSTKFSLSDFIKKAHKIHGYKYDYSNGEYKNAITKIKIICPEHGEFYITPSKHLNGQGCPLCGRKKLGMYIKSNTKEFIFKAKKIHGDKYDYSKVNYTNNHTKVCIICPIHGEFWQAPSSHLQGHCCPECGKKFGIAEKQVLKALREKYENVEYQYPPKWLKSKTSPQTIDFYLPEYNIGIEYQGRQHFYSNKKFGGDEEFEKILKRDKRKFELCSNNEVKLFYVSFEKKIPDTYMDKIYHSIDELLTAIDEYIEKSRQYKINESELSFIVQEVVNKLFK